jgi:hypothetical protein
MGKVAETLGSGLITAPAEIVSGIVQSRAANKATEAQERSAAAALAFSREQEAEQKRRYEQGKSQYDRQVADWYAARNALLGDRYGVNINLGSGGLPTLPSGPAGGAMPGGAMPGVVASNRTSPQPGGATIRDLAVPDATQRVWSDWSRYGL